MFKISNTIRSAETPDGQILLDTHRGRMFALNTTGAKIIELVGHGHNESHIVEEISREYGADQELVRRDVIGFLEALEQNHILERAGAVNMTSRESKEV